MGGTVRQQVSFTSQASTTNVGPRDRAHLCGSSQRGRPKGCLPALLRGSARPTFHRYGCREKVEIPRVPRRAASLKRTGAPPLNLSPLVLTAPVASRHIHVYRHERRLHRSSNSSPSRGGNRVAARRATNFPAEFAARLDPCRPNPAGIGLAQPCPLAQSRIIRCTYQFVASGRPQSGSYTSRNIGEYHIRRDIG